MLFAYCYTCVIHVYQNVFLGLSLKEFEKPKKHPCVYLMLVCVFTVKYLSYLGMAPVPIKYVLEKVKIEKEIRT